MFAQNITTTALELALLETCQALGELSSSDFSPQQILETPLVQNVSRQMQAGLPLKFLLPAFPAKSPSQQKTAGVLPDLGEVIALQALNRLCARIAARYAPGAQVLICSDGRIFSDVVGVGDEVIDQYQAGIDGIIEEFNLRHLATFAMDDLFPGLKGNELRERVLWQFGKCSEEIRHLVVTDEDFNGLFNGLHKFMVEDRLGQGLQKSKNQIHKETKQATYELMRRSDAWSQLLNHYHPGALRLSIHPYPLGHEKFGVRLVNTSSKWATPWHNVTVRVNGDYQLMHLSEALKLGAHKKMFGGKYVYFEV